MNYSLANELKDSGFPQHTYTTADVKQRDLDVVKAIYEGLRMPTLSELIEACGIFPEYQISLYGRSEDRWEATRVRLDLVGQPQLCNVTKIGSTPEEAVARLWLILNKK